MSAPLSSQSSAQAAACARPGSRGGDPRCLATRGPNPEWRRRRRRKRKCPESRARQAWAPRPLGTPQEGTAPGQACSERGFPPGLGGLGRGPEHAAACEGTGRDAWPSARGQAMAWMLFFEVQNLGCAPRGGFAPVGERPQLLQGRRQQRFKGLNLLLNPAASKRKLESLLSLCPAHLDWGWWKGPLQWSWRTGSDGCLRGSIFRGGKPRVFWRLGPKGQGWEQKRPVGGSGGGSELVRGPRQSRGEADHPGLGSKHAVSEEAPSALWGTHRWFLICCRSWST